MGNPQKLGNFVNALFQDASNNIGIGGSPSGSYKLEVTGTAKVSSTLLVSGNVGINGGSTTSPLSIKVATNQNVRISSETSTAIQAVNDAASAYVALKVDGLSLLLNSQSGGNVGIGTSSPSSLLHLGVANAAVDGTKGVKITNPAGTTVMLECGVSSDSFVGTTSGSDFSIRTNNAERMRITSGGSVGINGTPPSTVKLGVFGASATSSDYAFACYTNAGGNLIYVRNDGFLYSVSAWSGSDRRLKENITDLDNGLEKVLGLKARKYDLIDSFKNQFGFIAQEVQEVIPDAVSVFQEETQMLAIKMDFIVPHLVKAVQELSAQNQDLKSRLDKAGL
jgi:hypothetical protein